MAIEERFAAVITVRDQTQSTLQAIGARFQAISRNSGLTSLGSAAMGVGRAMGNLAQQVASVVGPLASLGALAAAGGLATLAVHTAAAGDDLGDLSARTGIAIRDLQSLGEVASRAGVDQASLASSMQRLNRNMADAANGGNAEMASAMRQLGISMRGSNGEIRNAADMLPELADAFARNENQALRVRLATELFGKAGEAMLPMLINGSDALREGQERWARYGFNMEAVAETMSTADGQFKDLGVAISGMASAIGAKLAPVLGPLAAYIADWVTANRDLIATKIGEWAERASAAFTTFFADQGPLDRLAEFAAAIGRGVEAIGGVQSVLIGFGALAASPFIAALLSIGAALVPLGGALVTFGVALATTPIGLFVVAIGTLAGAALLIYENWSTVADFFKGVWEGIAAAFDWGWSKIQPIVDLLKSASSLIPTSMPTVTTVPITPEAQAQRRGNMGGRGAAGGFYGEASPLQSPLAAGAGAPQQGQVAVNVRFDNAPPGTRVEADASGGLVRQPSTDVGYSLGAAR